jgi:putative DNA primase/helicase
MVAKIQENESFSTYNTLSRDINVSVDLNTHEEIELSEEELQNLFTEVISEARAKKDNKEAQSLVRARLEPIIGETAVDRVIEAVVNMRKEDSTFDSARCIKNLESIQFTDIDEGKRVKQVMEFVYEEVFSKDGDKKDKGIFIEYELFNHFTLDKAGIKLVKKHCTDMFKVKKAEKIGSSKDNKLPKIEFAEIAENLLQKYKIFTMRDTGEHFIFENGVYKLDVSDKFISSKTREVYVETLINKLDSMDREIPEKIPQVDTGFIHEVIEYISDMTFIARNNVNKDDRYINFKNGLFDIESWNFIDHTPMLISTVQIPVNYNPGARCPAIEKYFQECELHSECIATLNEFAGYCLTTDKRIQKAFMLIGKGSNGKSVFINLLKIMLGPDCVSGESLQSLEKDKFRVANLFGKRLNAFPDLKDETLQTNEVFNTLTGNDYTVSGERKFQSSFDFVPTTKLLFSANKAPFARADNYAYYRRWILIKFTHTFEKSAIDESIINKLTTEEEKSGYLNQMLEGLQRLLKNKRYTYDPDVIDVEKEYMLHSDNVRVFNDTCLRDCGIGEEPTDKPMVYASYTKWCEINQLTPVKQVEFKKKLEKFGRKIKQSSRRLPGASYSITYICYEDTVIMNNYNQIEAYC